MLLIAYFSHRVSAYTLPPSPWTQSSLGNKMSCAFAIGIACHMNSDQLPTAKPWGPDQWVTAAVGCRVGNHPLGWWGSQLGSRSWQWSLPCSGAKVGWPQLQGLPGSKSELSTTNQLPWLLASARAKKLYGNISLIQELTQLCHHNICTTITSLRLLPYRLKIDNVKIVKEEINLKSSWLC